MSQPAKNESTDLNRVGAVLASAPSGLVDGLKGDISLRVDAHVHIYPSFPLGAFFSQAYRNLALCAGDGPFEGLLLLTETARDDAFTRLRQMATGEGQDSTMGGWSVHECAREDVSLRLVGPEGQVLFVVAGRQIVTQEDLEVLALGTTRAFADGEPISRVLDRVADPSVKAVVPWGFGKWLGERGRILSSLIQRSTPRDFELGDNRGRPRFWGRPKHFRAGAQEGFRVLPGSDPLPVGAGFKHVGAFGFELDGPFDPTCPWNSLLGALDARGAAIVPFGRGEGALAFVKDQIAMQLNKRQRATDRGES